MFYSKYSVLRSLLLPLGMGATVALPRPSPSQPQPCLLSFVCQFCAMKNRANVI
jgi:hypothetical protein